MTNKLLVTHQPAGSTATPTNITDAIKIDTQEGIKTTIDAFSFTIQANLKYDNFFNDGDNIKIYLGSGSSAPTIVMDGFIKEINLDITADKKIWNIAGQNRLEVLLNAQLPAAETATATAAAIIKRKINQANKYFLGSKYRPEINAELNSIDPVNGKIDDVSISLPNIPTPYFRPEMTIFMMIEQLSQKSYTGQETPYIFYLDSNNNFVWEHRTTAAEGTIRVGDFITAKVQKSVFDVINFAIIYAGVDFNGNPVTRYIYNNVGMIKGLRTKYFAMPRIATELADKTSKVGNLYTKDINGNTNNALYRALIQQAADAEGWKIVNLFGTPRYKATLTMKGTTAYSKSKIYDLNIDGVFRDADNKTVPSLELRLIEIQHIFTSKGWFTTLEILQDEGTVTGGA